ncbi:FecCD family ABC transporter permease [Jeotgalicoccus coquinae]|uniref:Hemin transport system permease protein HmuU n=1 Tax=Jeotgalicoccus coquinae TaxID=709509 RepID=A0A6V7RRN5_9STAP|nr:iron ABC transporter permease [Jeotgalicoccus coquinae]MBB6423910.1 iron complex transport system permease protein [Jeotgalicoccus coquinae]CAD2080498.1 Hemin transport system permease protein HmuU [Jeotgalicoccus coquinae]
MNKTNCILVFLLIISVIMSIFIGSVNFREVSNMQAFSIMLDVRLPRALMAILVGAALAMSGAVFQIILKNPMADSFTLGMANGAVLGAAITVVTIIPAVFAPVLSIFLGLLSLLFVLIIARKLDLTYRPETLIITGILLGAMLSGVLYIIILLFPEDTANIARYMFGSLGGADFTRVSVLLILTAVSFIILERYGYVLDLLKLGDIRAHALGVNVSVIRPLLLVTAAVPPLVAISYTGIIALVGIIIPQIILYIRPMNFRPLLKRSILIGGLYVLIIDTLGRTLIAPLQIPTGVMVMLSAVPLFIFLLYKRTLVIGHQ